MKVLDVHFHRGTPQNRVIVNDESINKNQADLTRQIKYYMNGQINSNEFYAVLDHHNISRCAKIDALVRSKEAGHVPKFSEFGKYILRDANGTDMYNRVDKVSINSNRIVTTGHAGRAFGIAQTKMSETVLDEII